MNWKGVANTPASTLSPSLANDGACSITNYSLETEDLLPDT